MTLVKFWNLEVLTHLVVTVMLLKYRSYNASNGTSNVLEPRSYNTFSGTHVAIEF
jgi:hypothetical protein